MLKNQRSHGMTVASSEAAGAGTDVKIGVGNRMRRYERSTITPDTPFNLGNAATARKIDVVDVGTVNTTGNAEWLLSSGRRATTIGERPLGL
jgi:hypothetical protein